jgi:hypothetical protein
LEESSDPPGAVANGVTSNVDTIDDAKGFGTVHTSELGFGGVTDAIDDAEAFGVVHTSGLGFGNVTVTVE